MYFLHQMIHSLIIHLLETIHIRILIQTMIIPIIVIFKIIMMLISIMMEKYFWTHKSPYLFTLITQAILINIIPLTTTTTPNSTHFYKIHHFLINMRTSSFPDNPAQVPIKTANQIKYNHVMVDRMWIVYYHQLLYSSILGISTVDLRQHLKKGISLWKVN